jgi:DNA-binding CsgD family transcriptional regulator
VPALARGDAERLLRFVAEAESFGDGHPFAGEFLTQLGRLVPADWITYSDCSGCPEDRGGFHLTRPGDEGFGRGLDWEAINRVRGAEDPVLVHTSQGRFEAVKASGFLTRRELHRTQLYGLALKPYDLEDMLGVRLRIPPPLRPKRFNFDRGGRDFSARDCAVLDFLNPHLVWLYRASENRRRLREALALHESTRAAVVLLEADDRVAFASSAARELIDRYFAEHGAGLPDSVVSWLRERRRAATQEPLRIDAGDRMLVVEFVDGALLLDERCRLPRLTAREREILDLVAEGRTNAQIAERLWLSPGTVRKHLDNVYAKLGVHTRTAAAAFVREQRLLSRDRGQRFVHPSEAELRLSRPSVPRTE